MRKLLCWLGFHSLVYKTVATFEGTAPDGSIKALNIHTTYCKHCSKGNK